MDLRSTQLKDTYGNLVTTGTTAGSPTTGGLQNGQGTLLTSVGIGTDSPTYNLHIKGDSGQTRLTLEAPANEATSVAFQNTGSATKYLIGYNDSEDAFFFYDDVANVERMRIDSGGDISFRDTSNNEAFYWDASEGSLGIGTTSPARELEVTGTGNVYARITAPTDADSTAIELVNTGETWTIRNDDTNSDALEFGTSGGTHLTVDTSGNVGIGTTSPDANLHVSGSGTQEFRITSSNGNPVLRLDGPSGNLSYIQWNSAGSAPLTFYDVTTSSERMRIDSNGKVGIGETSPSAKLEITGTDTEPLTVLNDTVYTFAGNVTTSQSNTHTVTIPFGSQNSHWSNFIVEIYASLSWAAGSSTPFAGRALYTFNTLTGILNITELEDNGQNLSFSATASGMDFIVTITTTATAGQEPNRIGVMAKVIRANSSVGNEPTSMTIA